ncbi:NADP-dependent oxidoreductase [Puia dinghuensis]|uniref:NADPH:quinone reductase n=1 Tax=Puia dinghuensis TaxID=1792502 RepID=A0A8J2XRY5_9BACT|nr:NADP-dependent oxidoreductase [Puia dinghuensis]GGB05117.1 NADPH:quinone reductase [Puia dinghuensis]
MKAIVLSKPGGVENLVVQDIRTPIPGDHEVLVQVRAISINPVDGYVRESGLLKLTVLHLQPEEQPVILGWDIAGTVTDTGRSVTRFKKGDDVFGLVNFEGHGKAYAEYVAAPESHLALKPAGISHEEAAGATLAALTAWQALVNYADVKKGDKVLIHAAAGGVGHYAVQIAKAFGAYVIGTSSAANKAFILGLGADEHLDYSAQRFEEVIKDADIVVDSVSDPANLARSIDALKPGGALVSLVHSFDKNIPIARKAREKKVFTHRLGVKSSGEDMAAIAKLLDSGALRSYISETFPLEQMGAAHTSMATGKTRGKLVVLP